MLVAVVALGIGAGGLARAAEPGPWLLRGGLGWIVPNDDSSAVTGLPGSGVEVDDSPTFAFTAGYMVTERSAVELLGIWPANHEIRGRGTLPGLGVRSVGEVDVFPPTLSVGYYFMPERRLRPHLGIGLNFTTYFDVEASAQTRAALGAGTRLEVEDSVGFAANVGFDLDVSPNVFLTANLWYVDINADATLTETALGDLDVDIDVDPWVVLVGAGVRF